MFLKAQRHDNSPTIMKKSNVYTRTGDHGTTSLVGGTRVPKNDPRLEAYGTIDELNSYIGVVISSAGVPPEVKETLTWVQNRLFNLGAYLATEPDSEWKPTTLTDADISRMELEIDRIDSMLPRHNRFILPGGHEAAARTHVARTIARRSERQMITLSQSAEVSPECMRFINRLSDYLFVVARYINVINDIQEIFWDKDCQ